MSAPNSYKHLKEILKRYWYVYGGFNGFLRSPYVHFSTLAVILANNVISGDEKWWSLTIEIIPNILGFTLGGFAIFLSFGDDKFRAAISGNDPDEDEDYSPYLSVCASFLHFILAQSLALFFALFGRLTQYITLPSPDECLLNYIVIFTNNIFEWVGFWLFFYSTTLIVAAALATFRIATWYEDFQTPDDE